MSEKINLVGSLSIEEQLIGNLNNQNSLYTGLLDKPLINGVVLDGNKTSKDLNIQEDKSFIYTQSRASSVWNVNHNLNKFPNVVIVDSSGNVVIGEITYIDLNNVTIAFSGAFSGKCYCN